MTDGNGGRHALGREDPSGVASDGIEAGQAGAAGDHQSAPEQPKTDPKARFAVSSFVPPEPEVQFADKRRRTAEEKTEARRLRARRVRRRRIAGWSMLGAGVVILGGMAWVGWRSYQAYTHLENASSAVSTLQQQLQDITDNDPAATAVVVDRLQAESAAARSAVDDPVFGVATHVPFVGANLDTIRQVSTTVDTLATDVMPSLVTIAQTLQPSNLTPVDGVFDLAPIIQVSPLLQTADAAVNQARAEMAAIDRTAVVEPVSDAVVMLWQKLDKAAEVTDPAARIARLLPPMLGAEGKRTYLVAFQNPAELRATGGIFGSFAVVEADQGKVTIADQGAASRTLGYFDPPVAELSPQQLATYSPLLAQYPQDVNLTPDFPTAANLFAQMYSVKTGNAVDGVLAIDPVALSYLLEGSEPIDVGDGVTVTADNLVPILLSTAYEKFGDDRDQSGRDAFLAGATAKVFSSVMSGNGTAGAIIDGLRKAALERRILISSTDQQEQADLATTGVSGAIDNNPAQPSIGVFMNDATAAKLGYYLQNDVQVTEGECRSDGRRELKVKVAMKYDAPAEGLPAYVVGDNDSENTYELRTNVLVFAPLGGGVAGAERDGTAIGLGRGEDHSREVGTATVEMLPGTTTEVTFTVLGPVGGGTAADVEPRLILTPGVKPWTTSVDEYRVCRTTQE